jgi:hypothetical protein
MFNFNKFALYWRFSVSGPLTNSLMPITDSIYNWSFTGSQSTGSYLKNPSATFTLAGNQSAQLTVNYRPMANGGLHSSITDVATGTLDVSSNNAPVIAISGNTAICSGNSATLTASGNTTFTWTTPATTSPSIIVSPNVTTIYTVAAENAGCLSTRTIALIVSIQPTVTVGGSTQSCVGKVYTLTATGADSYSWSTTSTSSVITAVTQTAGTAEYTVTGTNNGCPPSIVIKQVIINALPAVSVTADKNKVCKNSSALSQTITLTGNPAGGVFSGSAFANGKFVPISTGTFNATYSYTDQSTTCSKSATTAVVVEDCTGFGKKSVFDQSNVYPNPVLNGLLHITNLPAGINQLEVYNILGVLVNSFSCDRAEHVFDLSAQPQGTYFLKISDATGYTKTVKIVNQF